MLNAQMFMTKNPRVCSQLWTTQREAWSENAYGISQTEMTTHSHSYSEIKKKKKKKEGSHA